MCVPCKTDCMTKALEAAEAEVSRLELQNRELQNAVDRANASMLKHQKHNGALEIALQEAHRDMDAAIEQRDKAYAEVDKTNRLNESLQKLIKRVDDYFCNPEFGQYDSVPVLIVPPDLAQAVRSIAERPIDEPWRCPTCKARLRDPFANECMNGHQIIKPKSEGLCGVTPEGPGGYCHNPMPCPIHPRTIEKRKCEHEWPHIEDSHFFCAKCKGVADLCSACGTEYTRTRDGVLVCLKCNPQ